MKGLVPWLVPVLAGALLFALFGAVPARLERAGGDAAGWALPELPDRSGSEADAVAVWNERRPWGGAPATDGEAERPPPAPVPVAIVSTASGHEAIFFIAGSGEVRVRAGDMLPDGGRVEKVDTLTVAWTDGQGQAQEQRLLADRQRPLESVP